ncbi:MAG: DUF2807 domain-containing protein [Bacteroidia bacterium]|nr:DUF2807 domain-containing protein [Bacteroidia bacterium]
MNSIFSKFILAAASMAMLTGCWEDPKLFPCENGSGVITTETRTLDAFTQLIVDIPADIYLHRDTAFSLDIEAQESLLEWIDTDVSGNVLEIRNDRCFRNHKTIRIDVYLPEFDYLEVVGSGDVYGVDMFTNTKLDMEIKGSGSIQLDATADQITLKITGSGDADLNLTTDYLNSKITGSGDLVTEGSATVHDARIEGSGSLEAFDLTTDETDINISGSGDAEVFVNTQLTVKIVGSGDVFYKGTPAIDVNVSGSGEVVNVN